MNCLDIFLFGFLIHVVGVLFQIYDLDQENLALALKMKSLSVRDADDLKKNSLNSFCFILNNLSFDAKPLLRKYPEDTLSRFEFCSLLYFFLCFYESFHMAYAQLQAFLQIYSYFYYLYEIKFI